MWSPQVSQHPITQQLHWPGYPPMVRRMHRRWIFPPSTRDSAVRRLSHDLDIPAFLAGVLARNGFDDPDAAVDFLQPRLRNLGDPMILPDMPQAAARVVEAIRTKEQIVLYGDYDVDGVSSLTLLHRVLTTLGGRVACFLPLRSEEGYGLSTSGVERCFEEHGPSLLIAVDCGTNSTREAANIRERGADLIILDHHEPAGERPNCVALVNPKFGTDYQYLCSAGLAFKMAHAVLKVKPDTRVDLKDYLDLVALATVADLVPLVAENRILVHRGLLQMAHTRWPGLAALMTVAGVRTPVRGSDIGFRLGPRINASGRLGTALESLKLLLSDDPAESALLADSLDQQNRDRQNVERLLSQEVEAWVTAHFEASRDASIVAGQRDWHHGVLGIVASRIMRQHHRPTLLVGFGDDGLGKGSGRSIEGFSLVETLGLCADHLEKFGGHEMAAGVTVQEGNFETFRQEFEACARERVNEDILTPKLRVDAELDLAEIDLTLLETQGMLEPYGMANAQPVFAARGITPASTPRILKEKHFRLDFQSGRQRVPAIFFHGATRDLPRPPWDVAFTVERNEFNGRVDAQMQVVAIRAAA